MLNQYRVNHDQAGYFVEIHLSDNTWQPISPRNFRHDVPETAIDAIMEITAHEGNVDISRDDIQVVEK